MSMRDEYLRTITRHEVGKGLEGLSKIQEDASIFLDIYI